jgi:hypothetical protein
MATATVTTPTPEDAVAVYYAGSSERLLDKFTRSEAATLRIWAVRVAHQVGAMLHISESGQYDYWVE